MRPSSPELLQILIDIPTGESEEGKFLKNRAKRIKSSAVRKDKRLRWRMGCVSKTETVNLPRERTTLFRIQNSVNNKNPENGT